MIWLKAWSFKKNNNCNMGVEPMIELLKETTHLKKLCLRCKTFEFLERRRGIGEHGHAHHKAYTPKTNPSRRAKGFWFRWASTDCPTFVKTIAWPSHKGSSCLVPTSAANCIWLYPSHNTIGSCMLPQICWSNNRMILLVI